MDKTKIGMKGNTLTGKMKRSPDTPPPPQKKEGEREPMES